MRNSKDFADSWDVIVVGGGVIGLSIAREIGRCGMRVVVVERGKMGREASQAAAGMLAPQSEADQSDEFFRLQCASRDLYPKFAGELREETGEDIELDQTGTLYLALDREDEEELERRFAWQTGAGLSVERLTGAEARALEPSISPRVRLALRFPFDWQVENRLLIRSLVASLKSSGVKILTETEVINLRVDTRGRIEGVGTTGGLLSTQKVVIAAGAWSSHLPFAVAGGIDDNSSHRTTTRQHPHITPVRGQMLCFRHAAAVPFARHVIYTPRGYIVPRRDGRILAGSTTEVVGYKPGVTVGGVQSIATHALETAPSIRELSFFEAWAGLRPRAEDERPVLGASEEVRGLYYATGHYRNGILLAPLTGKLIAGLIVDGRPSPLLEPFTPERFRRNLCAAAHGE
jgi:glycine oxidase